MNATLFTPITWDYEPVRDASVFTDGLWNWIVETQPTAKMGALVTPTTLSEVILAMIGVIVSALQVLDVKVVKGPRPRVI